MERGRKVSAEVASESARRQHLDGSGSRGQAQRRSGDAAPLAAGRCAGRVPRLPGPADRSLLHPDPEPYTQDVARTFVEVRGRDWATEDERSFAIVDAATDELLGSIARHGPYGHRATFGYWLAPQARGRGVATRALRLITDWTLETTDVIRLDLFTDIENDASGRVAERVGFEREGIRRAWDLDRQGRPLDVIFYVLVRDASGCDQVGSARDRANT